MSKNVNNEVRMNPPIYKHGQEVELRATENNIGSQSEQDLNPEPMDFKSGVLTTRPRCEWTVWQLKDMIDHPSYISQIKQLWNESLKKKIFWPERDLNPWPLQHQCSDLPTELSSHLEVMINHIFIIIIFLHSSNIYIHMNLTIILLLLPKENKLASVFKVIPQK